MLNKYIKLGFIIIYLIISLFYISKDANNKLVQAPYVAHLDGENNFYIRYLFSFNDDEIYGIKDKKIIYPTDRTDIQYYLTEVRFDTALDSVVIGKTGHILIKDMGEDNRYIRYIKDHLIILFLIPLIIFILYREKKTLFVNSIGIIILLSFNMIFLHIFLNSFFNFMVYVVNILVIAFSIYFSVPNTKEIYDMQLNRSKKDFWLMIIFPIIYGIAYIYMYAFHYDIPLIRDTYHTGEVLLQYLGLKNGLYPYKDVFIIHGLLQDPFQVYMGFKLFGENIGSYCIFSSIIAIFTNILFAWFAWRILSRKCFYLFIFLFYILGYYTFIVTDRLLPIIIFLIIFEMKKDKIINYIYYFIVFALLYSLDTGIILFMIAIIVLFLYKDFIDIKKTSINMIVSLFLFLAGIKFQIIPFVKFLLYLLKDYESIWGTNYPFLSFNNIVLYAVLPIFIHGISLGVVLKRKDKIDWIFYLSGFLFFYGAINRSDFSSVAGGIILSFLFFIYFIQNERNNLLFIFIAILLFTMPSQSLIELSNKMNLKEVFSDYNRILTAKQTEFLPVYYDRAIKKTDSNRVYVLSSEGIFYYLLNTPYYTKYMLPIFAHSEREQKDVIDALEKNRIRYIIYNKHIWSFYPEGKPFKVSRKLIYDYINSKYKVSDTFGDIIIMKRE